MSLPVFFIWQTICPISHHLIWGICKPSQMTVPGVLLFFFPASCLIDWFSSNVANDNWSNMTNYGLPEVTHATYQYRQKNIQKPLVGFSPHEFWNDELLDINVKNNHLGLWKGKTTTSDSVSDIGSSGTSQVSLCTQYDKQNNHTVTKTNMYQ